MTLKITQDLSKVNYSKGNSGRKYIVIHYTGNNTDSATGNANYFRNTSRGASAHYFVDNTGVVQVVADNNTAWAQGRNYGSGNLFGIVTNSNALSIEMCGTNGKVADSTFTNTVKLTKMLMSKYAIPASNVVRHWDVASKRCPGWSGWLPGNESLWNNFKSQLGSDITPVPHAPVSPVNSGVNAYTGDSIIEYLNSIGVDSSQDNRRKLSVQYGVVNYDFSAKKNLELLSKMRIGNKASSTSVPTPSPSKSSYTGTSIIDYLKSIGQDSSMSARRKLAAQNGINNYTATASQNTALLNKLRGGSATPVAQSTPTSSRKSNETIAREVIAGKWGNNPQRKQKLQAAGYDYNVIQRLVNGLV